MYPITIGQGSLAVSPQSSAQNYNSLVFVNGQITVGGNGTNTITFPPLPSSTLAYGTNPIPLKATASSQLAVTYTTTGTAAVVTGSASTGYYLTFVGVGSGSVIANQAGNTDFGPANSVTQTFNVTPAVITVTATPVSEPYGSTVTPSQLPYTISPTTLFNGDFLTGTPALSTTATAATPVNTTVPISVAQAL